MRLAIFLSLVGLLVLGAVPAVVSSASAAGPVDSHFVSKGSVTLLAQNQPSPSQPKRDTSQPQEPKRDVRVDVDIEHGGGGWYANPVWIAIGVIALVVLVLLVVMAARGGGSQTVVK